ncbi:hypothetical protein KDW85_02205 [Burkholderia cenocepacia]|uniref:hypothetical protein n=1 Tax=Burkholderia cenocepacia TaxID=95486 RepID=UPI001B990E8D|nr:hypothetical protein [Burkholderia cenocepacia]MBR8037200.1 hypothetical protein [Burkholderia cenocepacia]
MDPEYGVRAGVGRRRARAAGWRLPARLTYNTPKCALPRIDSRAGAAAAKRLQSGCEAAAKRLRSGRKAPAGAGAARQATAATLLRDGASSGTSNTS